MRARNGPGRPEKILLAMFKLSGATTKPLKYEDIVVAAFKTFPEEFALRGHPEYPDSSDIHKPLYGPLKRGGLVRSANKTFALTPHGVEMARRIHGDSDEPVRGRNGKNGDRMPRDVALEVERMRGSEAYRFFVNGFKEKVLDTDFYTFLGCTVRTPRNDFLGRLSASAHAIEVARQLSQPSAEVAEELSDLWEFLGQRFRPEIERRQGRQLNGKAGRG